MSLKDSNFASETVTNRSRGVSQAQLLASSEEIRRNSLWRFLHLREYVDSKHNLTPWGEVLASALEALDGKRELEESVLLAVEMARLGLMNAEPIFHYNGGPARGSGKCLLIKGFRTILIYCRLRPTVHSPNIQGRLFRSVAASRGRIYWPSEP